MARYMLIMRSTPEAEAAMEEQNIDFDEIIESMGRFNEELIKAGVLLAGEGLTGPEEGFVVDFNADPPVVTDGPYTEAKELFNGFWILDVSSKEEAKQWARKVPLGQGVKLEVRRVSETEEFPQDNPWIQKEIQWKADLAEKVAAEARKTRAAKAAASAFCRNRSRAIDLTDAVSAKEPSVLEHVLVWCHDFRRRLLARALIRRPAAPSASTPATSWSARSSGTRTSR